MSKNELSIAEGREARNKELLLMRSLMQHSIIKTPDLNDKMMGFVERVDVVRFLNQYREYLLATRKQFPAYLFGMYNQDFFEECIQMQMNGATLLEADMHYQNLLFGTQTNSYKAKTENID